MRVYLLSTDDVKRKPPPRLLQHRISSAITACTRLLAWHNSISHSYFDQRRIVAYLQTPCVKSNTARIVWRSYQSLCFIKGKLWRRVKCFRASAYIFVYVVIRVLPAYSAKVAASSPMVSPQAFVYRGIADTHTLLMQYGWLTRKVYGYVFAYSYVYSSSTAACSCTCELTLVQIQ
jgi:hypothetical protein